MKTIQLEIPDGKEAKWVDGVLTLVDEPKNITDRIKTFEDAVEWCKNNGKKEVVEQMDYIKYDGPCFPLDVLAYLKLRIITAALNEGWEPTLDEGEERWAVAYEFVHKKLDSFPFAVFASTSANLFFKSEELAKYAAEQFSDIYAIFIGFKKGGQQ